MTVVLNYDRLVNRKDLIAKMLPLAREFKRRIDHPFYAYQPDCHKDRPQLAAHACTAAYRLVKGGNQSGKSRWGAQEVAWWLLGNHPYRKVPSPCRIWVVSTHYQTIQEGVYRHLIKDHVLPEWEIAEVGSLIPQTQVRSWVKVKSGSQVDFISAKGGEQARQKTQAAAINFVLIDEEISDDVAQEIQMRLLQSGGSMAISATLMISPVWILDLEDRAAEKSPDVSVFTFKTKRAVDAGHVSRDHYKRLELLLSEDDQRVRLLGESRRAQGIVYPEFDPNVHVCEPFDIPAEWTRYCAIDPGWRTCAVLWIAVAPGGSKYYIYRELYLHENRLGEVADKIYASEGWSYLHDANVWVRNRSTEKIFRRWIDPSCFGVHPGGEKMIGTLLLTDHRIRCIPALNELEPGIERVKRDFLLDLDGMPRCKVFSSCSNYIKEVRSYRRRQDSIDTFSPERNEKPISRNDHLLDCHRYMVSGGLVEDRGQRAYGDKAWVRELIDEPITAKNHMEAARQRDLKRVMKLHMRRRGNRHVLHGGIGSEG